MTWAFSNCDLGLLSCDLGLLSCDLGLLSCDLGLLSCDLGILNCDLGLLSCDLSLLSCDSSLLICDLGLAGAAHEGKDEYCSAMSNNIRKVDVSVSLYITWQTGIPWKTRVSASLAGSE